jgi:cytochrome b subunit of formate dehydrogenase
MDARRGFALALALVALLVGVSASAWAATIKAEDCLGCHADKDLKKQVGGKSVSLFADEAALKGSVHRKLDCVGCHVGITEIPHPEKLPTPTCTQCHGQAQTVFRQSVHGRAGAPGLACQSCHGSHDVKPAATLGTAPCASCHADVIQAYQGSAHGKALAKGVTEAAQCGNCHSSAHTLKSRQEPDAPTNRTRMAETCGKCHADRALIEKRGIPIPQAFQLYQKSVHGRAVAAGKAGATCNDCHRSHDLLRATDPKSSIYRENIPATCGACHAGESALFLESIHGTAMRKGVTKSPVCTDCHGEHSIRATQDPASRVSVASVTTTCASCHEAAAITEKYGLPGGRLQSYTDSFHGLAARGGSKVAANCASCHGTHDIRPSSDPKSSISPGNLPKTCGSCHPGAGENFARGPVHVEVSRAGSPILFYVERFYLLLIILTIGGMGAHNGLDFLRKLRREYRRKGGAAAAVAQGEDEPHGVGRPRWYLRMTPFERIQHALLASSFLVLVYSGFALKFPETWLFRGFTALEQGYALRGWIHRGAALVMTAACLLHLCYLPTKRGRRFLLDMLPRPSDIRESLQQVGYLVGLRAEPARFDRFGYIEKAEYWALIWGSVIMAATGFALWFETDALRLLPLWALDVATLVHFYEALLATLAIAVWHFYYVIFNPDVYPMNWAWLTGKISEAMMHHEHPRELERLQAEERAAEGAEEQTPKA